jgi:hypothetical protein
MSVAALWGSFDSTFGSAGQSNPFADQLELPFLVGIGVGFEPSYDEPLLRDRDRRASFPDGSQQSAPAIESGESAY